MVAGSWNQLVKWWDPRTPCNVGPLPQPEKSPTPQHESLPGCGDSRPQTVGAGVKEHEAKCRHVILQVGTICKQGYVLSSVKCQIAI